MSRRGPQDAPFGLVNARQVLVVVCGKTCFAVPTEILRGIVRPEEAVASMGGPCPLVDLAARFDLPGSSLSGDSRVLLCGWREVQQALRVDRVIGLTEIEGLAIQPLSPHFSGPERHWFSGIFLFRGTVALLLNPQWLLAEGGGVGLSTAPVLDLEPKPALDLTAEPGGLPWPHHSGGNRDPLAGLEESLDDDDTPWAQL